MEIQTMFKSQREAARHFIKEYCRDKEIPVEGDMKEKLDKSAQSDIAYMMAVAAVDGNIPVKSDKYETEKEYHKYFKGQVNDTLRKDIALNGGEKYEAKEPGKLKGSRDEVMKELKKAAKAYADKPELLAEINTEIEKRQAELDAAKASVSKEDIDWNKIPGLAHLKPDNKTISCSNCEQEFVKTSENNICPSCEQLSLSHGDEY